MLETFRSLFGLERSGFPGRMPESELSARLLEKCRRNRGRHGPFHLLREIPFVVFDTETTGLSVPDDDVIALGAVALGLDAGGDRCPSFDRLVNPHRPIPALAREITGIDDEMVCAQPTIYPVLDDFLDFIDGAVLVAHGIAFDVGFLDKYLKPLRTRLYHPVIDTITLSRVIEPFRTDHSLDALVPDWRIAPRRRHSALGDAQMTADLFAAMLARLQTLRPVSTLGELQRILAQQHL
ncbi:3'-5' exonuclease [Heliobacterium gestii]|uniref:3'-5' exonuclease n=1 Tax=Heliomicrobium gestii TaxID=2699 RepID=A0A845L9D0_HELGE|nr:3'-5' exonuclease [Heliomicrobium gestii]MBM7865266.1 DNA polymerase III epsilon subunit family exonuclease [Heliomicrobium gestii]MZP41530.1 3'-5' exonuclease [Heliomicrobium gestii]